MAFGLPIRYWQLDPKYVCGGAEAWDRAVKEASDEYKGHIVYFFPIFYIIYYSRSLSVAPVLLW